MNRLKVLTLIGTRPEIIRLSETIKKLDEFTQHILVHTGQNYDFELNQIFFDDLDLRQPDYLLNAALPTSSQTIGNIIIEVDKILQEENPDAVFVLGDTNSCLGVLPARKRNIPIFHMEAGNRCFDRNVPEEINRRLVDHVSDINLTYSAIARQHLLAERIAPDTVIKVGSPMKEVIAANRDKINTSAVLDKLGLKTKHYFLVSVHRHENIEDKNKFSKFITFLNYLADLGFPVIMSTHPRTREMLEKHKIEINGVEFLKPLSFSDYCALQMSSKVTFSDSGTITEESSILGFPALNLRESHERPEGMELATVMLVGFDLKRIEAALSYIEGTSYVPAQIVPDYDFDDVSDRIVRIIFSYLNYQTERR